MAEEIIPPKDAIWMPINGGATLIDEVFLEGLALFPWQVDEGGYASFGAGRSRTALHRLVNGTPKGLFTDHINGNRLDNRRANLRTVTRQQNLWNSKPQSKSSSRYKGVRYKNPRGLVGRTPWQAVISRNGTTFILGSFSSEDEAARVYDSAARSAFGEYAWLNFP